MVATDGDRVVARGLGVPFDAGTDGREEMPDQGWDRVLVWAFHPWVRVHVRAGGTIEKVTPASMTVSGSLAQWRQWTGLPFDRDGYVDVPGALAPVHCDTVHDHAVYVEPNVWIRHGVEPHTA
nr:hypothetical protein [Streptomyces sp. NBC_01435]